MTTLKDATEHYLQHLIEKGQTPSTVGTAKRALSLLAAHMGEDKLVGKILVVHIAGFYASEEATRMGDKPRATQSILQIRRIIRAAICWWHEQGWIASVPLPKDERRFIEPRPTKSSSPEASPSAADAAAEEPDDDEPDDDEPDDDEPDDDEPDDDEPVAEPIPPVPAANIAPEEPVAAAPVAE